MQKIWEEMINRSAGPHQDHIPGSINELIEAMAEPAQIRCPDIGVNLKVNPDIKKWKHPDEVQSEIAIYCPSPVIFHHKKTWAGIQFNGQYARLYVDEVPSW